MAPRNIHVKRTYRLGFCYSFFLRIHTNEHENAPQLLCAMESFGSYFGEITFS